MIRKIVYLCSCEFEITSILLVLPLLINAIFYSQYGDFDSISLNRVINLKNVGFAIYFFIVIIVKLIAQLVITKFVDNKKWIIIKGSTYAVIEKIHARGLIVYLVSLLALYWLFKQFNLTWSANFNILIILGILLFQFFVAIMRFRHVKADSL